MDPKKISQLNELITAGVDDVLPIVNEGETKKISLSNLTSLKLDASKVDTDTELTANSDSKVPSQRAIKAYVDTQVGLSVTALWENKGLLDCSTNPDYPAGDSGDAYVVSVAGKIGGSSGTVVQVRDVIVCIGDNDGGGEGDVGSYWEVIQANLDQATESVKGIAEIATTTEVNTGTDDQRIVTPAKLAARITGMTTGTGTDSYVPKWNDGDAGTLTDSLIYDNGTNVGIGTSSPGTKLHVAGTGRFTSGTNTINIKPSTPSVEMNVDSYDGSIANGYFLGILFRHSEGYKFAKTDDDSFPIQIQPADFCVKLIGEPATSGDTQKESSQLLLTGQYYSFGSSHPVTATISCIPTNTSGGHYLNLDSAIHVYDSAFVGIGGDASARLHVHGTGSSDSTIAMQVDNGASSTLLSILDNGSTHVFCTASSGTTGILRVEGTTGSGRSYLHVATNGEVTIGETGSGIISQDAALVVNASAADDTKYALRVCDNATNPVFAARADGRVCIGNVGGSLSDFTATLRLSTSSSSSSNHLFDASSGALSNILHVRSDGRVGVGTSSPSGLLHIASDTIRLDTSRTPSSSSASGNAGEICWDSSYIYVCIASNTWKRSALSTW